MSEYLVTFLWSKEGSSGQKQLYCTANSLTSDATDEWRKQVIERDGYQGLIILNIIKLETKKFMSSYMSVFVHFAIITLIVYLVCSYFTEEQVWLSALSTLILIASVLQVHSMFVKE